MITSRVDMRYTLRAPHEVLEWCILSIERGETTTGWYETELEALTNAQELVDDAADSGDSAGLQVFVLHLKYQR